MLQGLSGVDVSSLTGESLPLQAQAGTELAAGSLNLDGALTVEVLRPGAESAVARIIHLVEQAQARKAPIQGLADRVAGRFTLFVLALAIATQVEKDQTKPVPVVRLKKEHYAHKKYGKVFTPVFEVVEWISLDGPAAAAPAAEAEPEAEEPAPADTGRRRRRAA